MRREVRKGERDIYVQEVTGSMDHVGHRGDSTAVTLAPTTATCPPNPPLKMELFLAIPVMKVAVRAVRAKWRGNQALKERNQGSSTR